jgi:antibiotic biosynthesis monooxygenase (ABM) superfamily enzyme
MDVCRIPTPYAKRCPPELLSQHVNYWLGEAEELKASFSRNGSNLLLGFTNSNYDPISNMPLLQVLERTVGNVSEYRNVQHSPKKTTVDVVSQRTSEPQLGDSVAWGLQFTNSLIGRHLPEIDLVNYRLVCTNGMVSSDVMFRYRHHRGENADILDWAEEIAARAWEEADRKQEEMNRSAQIPVSESMLEAVPGLLKWLDVPVKVRKYVMNQISMEKPETLWDLVNVITWIATHDSRIDNASIQRMLSIVGSKLMMDFSVCDHCHQALFSGVNV